MVRDMTTGSPLSHILRFFFPMLLGCLLQQAYVVTDSAIVGRFAGVEAFAGINSTGALYSLVVGFLFGSCHGFAVPVAQCFGAGKPDEMRRYCANAIWLTGILAVAMTALMLASAEGILRLTGTPPDILDDAVIYISILFGGMTASALYNLAGSLLRAVGDTRTPLVFLTLSSAVNVLLDLLCVMILRWGAAGAALATVAAQLLSGAPCAAAMFRRKSPLRVRAEEWRPDAARLRRLLDIGLPMGLESSMTAVGSMLMQRAVNALGTVSVAAVGAGDRIMFAFATPFDAIGATVATYCGQNFGAKRCDRIRRGVRLSLVALLIYCAAAYGAQRLFGSRLAGLLVGGGELEIRAAAARFLDAAILFFPGFLCIMIFRCALQAMGHTRIAMLAGLCETAARILVAFAVVPMWGFAGVCAAHPASWCAANALLIPAYLYWIRAHERANARS